MFNNRNKHFEVLLLYYQMTTNTAVNRNLSSVMNN